MPVRQHLLLVLPDGELHQFRCAGCGTAVGTKRETGGLTEKNGLDRREA